MEKKKKKLALNKETLRTLTKDEITVVNGAGASGGPAICGNPTNFGCEPQ